MDPILQWHALHLTTDEDETSSCGVQIEVFGHGGFFVRLSITETNLEGTRKDNAKIGPRSRGWADRWRLYCRGDVTDIVHAATWMGQFLRDQLTAVMESVVEDLEAFGVHVSTTVQSEPVDPDPILLDIARLAASVIAKRVSEKVVIPDNEAGFLLSSATQPPPELADLFEFVDDRYIRHFSAEEATELRTELRRRLEAVAT